MKGKKMLWTLLLIPLVLTMAIEIATAAPIRTQLYVSPGLVWEGLGDTFSVDIMVYYITPTMRLWAYQLELYYDPDVIHCVGYENGDFMESKGGYPIFVPGAGADNTAGVLQLFGAYLDPIAGFPFGMTGKLATVTFEVVGEGTSDIIIGDDSALINSVGRTIEMKPSLNGFVITLPGPELYVRRRGAHGGGIWPEWQVGDVCEDQTLYCRIMNYGEMAAEVKVNIEVSSAGYGTQMYETNVDTAPAATWVAGEIVPGEVIVSATFHPPGPGKFTVNGKLYFKAGPMTEFAYYGDAGIDLGGESDTRDIAEHYKVVA